MRINKRIRNEYESLLNEVGEERFFSHILGSGIIAKYEFDYPEVIMLDQAEAFFALFRTTGNLNYFIIGKLLRRAAHKLYRQFKRKDEAYPNDRRILRAV